MTSSSADRDSDQGSGGIRPLAGVRVVEFSALGPVHHAAMLLADLGADIVQIERKGFESRNVTPLLRGRRFHFLDLKSPDDREWALAEIDQADVLLEGFRPGVMERLGLGPADVAPRNPGLVYGRMTGWGQHGTRAHQAGHDINYIAETGALWSVRRKNSPPVAPINLIGDNGGGSLFLVNGVLSALLERTRTGHGSVIDAAIVDGVTSMLETIRGFQIDGAWDNPPGENLLDTGAPFYDVYECADGQYMAVGAVEEKFYEQLLIGLELAADQLPSRDDPRNWDAIRSRFTEAFTAHPRAHWVRVFDKLDACTTPVLSLDEATKSEHLLARGSLHISPGGVPSAASAPRIMPLPLQAN